MNAQRGQSVPIWAFGTLSALVLLAMALNYGSTLRWQIRAQNAADAAARGMLAVQTSQWNETIAAVHAAALEEYRLRLIMNDLLEVIQGSGGCDAKTGDSGPSTCSAMYANLRQRYFDGLQRYTNDILVLNRISYPSQSTQISQIKAALALYQQNCGKSTGGDCAFNYSLVAASPRHDSYVEDVYADCCAFAVGGNTTGNPKTDLSPLDVEVIACANVPPAFPSFFNFTPQTYQAIGRAAATSIMGTQEFMYVGSLVNPSSNSVFQGAEYPESATNTPIFSGDDNNYRIDYGGNPNNADNQGNPAVSDGKWGFTYTPQNEGFLAATGWWESMAIKPFSGQLSNGVQYTCK
ncbi:MAG TPA: pilus assembly protein TadG-related protein [Candidatus Baltobacteraceae bacterium]|nr:pilus assembly protein TadG-related protein [Candidatus Baltobacteraceae bacterium]